MAWLVPRSWGKNGCGRFYFLGNTSSVVEEASRVVGRLYPKLTIAGDCNDGLKREDEASIVAARNAARPDILWIGAGVPTAQSFALRNRARLCGVGVIAAAAGLLELLSGEDSSSAG